METSFAGLDRFVADVPAPLRSALSDAAAGADAGIGVRVFRCIAGEAGTETAESSVAMLEAADRAEAGIHGLDGGDLQTGATGHPNGVAALAAGWLRARSGELAGEVGGSATGLHADATRAQAAGRIMEAEDLYDAARPADRYLEAARLRSGALVSLAAALGAAVSGASDDEAEGLTQAGRSLGIAARIQRDVTGFVTRFVAGAATSTATPGGALSNGVYSLPVIRAVEAEPRIASALGGPVAGEKLLDLVARIKDAGGLARAAEDCREHADAAVAAVGGIERGAELGVLAAEAADSASGAAAR